MTSKTYTMIDPKQIAKKGYKGCKTTAAVQNFCKKNYVDCCIWKPQGSSQKIMMIEWNSFRNAYKANQTNTAGMTTTKTKTKPTRTRSSNVTSINSRRSRTTSRTNNKTTARTTGGTKNRNRTTARKTYSVWGTTQTKKTNNARRMNSGTKIRRAA